LGGRQTGAEFGGHPCINAVGLSDNFHTLVLRGVQVVVHFGVQRTLCQRLLQLIQQAALVERGTRLRTREQLVKHGIRYLGC
jgi:hypothetical protein